VKLADAGALLKESASEWVDDKATRLGAALAYYSVFSLGPLLMIVIAVAGFFFGDDAVSGRMSHELQGIVGANGAAAIEAMVKGASKPSSGLWATVLSVGALLFAATGVVVQLKDALNTIWDVRPKPGRGVRLFLRQYVVSLAALLGIGFILMASLVLTAVLAYVGDRFATVLPLPEWLLQGMNFVVSFGVITALFALMYKLLPDVKIAWRDVWVGALSTAFLFTVGRLGIGLYIGTQSFDSTFGAASSLILVLVWVYYLSQVFFFGAELTKAYALKYGSKIEPIDDAELVSPGEGGVRAKREPRPARVSTRHQPSHFRGGVTDPPPA